MGFTWYSPKSKQIVDVKVTKSSIVITDTGLSKLASIIPGFNQAGTVKLGWDPDRGLVAIAPTAEEDKGGFKIARRGRSQSSRTINAAKFFEAFSITVDEDAPNEPELIPEEGAGVFKLNVRAASLNGATTVRRRRGRQPRVVAE
ncbi:MAG: hypothetical protein ACLQVD_07860 [Capsulimonadaceae bacterium]